VKIPWRKIAGEGALIVVSVFIAIALESAWQYQRDRQDAIEVLAQLLEELRQDRSEAEVVLAEQRELGELYQQLLGWLSDPGSLPGERFQKHLDRLGVSNRTMFPRSSAWTTLVASAQLPLLNDSALVSQVGYHYEVVHQRLRDNSVDYDDQLFIFLRDSVPTTWDVDASKLSTDDPRELAEFRYQVRYLSEVWNRWYVEFLEMTYLPSVDDLIEAVEKHLASEGYG